MKKNLLIGLLVLATIFLGIFVDIKSNEANNQTIVALENQILALENSEKAKQQVIKATEAAAKARAAELKIIALQRALEVCN
ncbi:MAG: hypothetical protein ABJH98_01105 [Reichenbachiella sp.]|uniref:hypothetical protein n=1 Tax=Reichenbachiella sp. TaxID=2184521 RepID=UPI003296BFB8